MRIGEASAQAGAPTKTIRFWESERLLAAPSRTPAGYRDYPTSVIERLMFIRNAQAAGFSLAQIRNVLDIIDTGQPPCQHVSRLIHQHLTELNDRIAELHKARAALQDLARRAAEQDPADCHGHCSIIQAPATP